MIVFFIETVSLPKIKVTFFTTNFFGIYYTNKMAHKQTVTTN